MFYEIIFIIFILLIIYIFYIISKKNSQEIITCFKSRWGCCKDNYTPKLDSFGSNCRGF